MQTSYLEHGKSAAADFDPTHYVYVSTGYNGDSDESLIACYDTRWSEERDIQDAAEDEARAQEPYSGLNRRWHGAKCLHCGANLKWFVLFRDKRTGLLLCTGTTCAAELQLPDKGHLVRKQLAERIETARKLAKIDLAYPGLRAELDRVTANLDRAYFSDFLLDLQHKVNRYHEISDRQAATLKRFLGQGLDRIEERAAKDAAQGPRADVPEFGDARVTIQATLISTKWVDNQFGGGVKMLVEHKDGWRLYGSCPAAICNSEPTRGDVVQFDAVVTRSDKDPKFGFFNRPTKARITKDAPDKVKAL